jgi:hypothetical protein
MTSVMSCVEGGTAGYYWIAMDWMLVGVLEKHKDGMVRVGE